MLLKGNLFLLCFSTIRSCVKPQLDLIGTTLDQTVNTGIMTVAGTTIALAQDIVFTATDYGTQQNLQAALRSSFRS